MDGDLLQLVQRAQNGDRAAFEELIAMFQRPVFLTVLRVVQDTHVADDVTQEVFVKAYRAMAGLQEAVTFKSWLLKIAMNRAIDYRRRRSREREQVFLFDQEPAGLSRESSEQDTVRTRELSAAFQDALGALPEKMQKVMLLSLDGELSQEDAARVLECPVGTVKSRLFHARRLLRERLRKYL